MNECRCGRPTRDQAFICDTCTDKLAHALGECPWADTELQTTLAGERGIDYRRSGTRTKETPIPVNIAASNARTDLRAVLTSWVKFCAEENVRHQSPHPGIPTDDIPAMSRWLLWRVDGLALLDIGPEAVDEITSAISKCKQIIDRPADKWFAGPCDCGEDLYARLQKGTIKCRVADCALEYDVAARREWLLEAAEDQLVIAADVARAVSWLGAAPLTSDRVRKWAERGRLAAKGHDGRYPLYRVGDAIDLLASTSRTA